MKEQINNSEIHAKQAVGIGVKKIFFYLIAAIFIAGVLLTIFFFNLKSAPSHNDVVSFEVERGQSVKEISARAKTNNLVKSEFLLYAILTYFYDPTNIYAGTYVFAGDEDVFAVAKKLASSDIKAEIIKITIPEGMTVADIAKVSAQKFSNVDYDEFIQLAEEKEGFLFPETYFVPPNFTTKELVELMNETYRDTVSNLAGEFKNSDLSEKEIITLASIIEKEGKDKVSMEMISGILQNRLEIDMPLQADATLGYVLEKSLTKLTPEDLKIDSPYNTYIHTGLPPTPIANPGLMAIEAVLHPTKTDNFYYITGTDGKFYYAKTYKAHQRNIAQHLR